VKHDLIGTLALARAKGPCNGRRDTGAHAAVGRLQNEHHKRKCERGTCQSVSPDTPEKEPVKYDYTNEGHQVMLGAASRSSVDSIGPSSRSFVRVAGGRGAAFVTGDAGDQEIETL